MLFGYFTLAVAFFLSFVAAYYSVLGLVAIFSAAVIPVMIMGGALETGKVVAAMWLHRNWHRAPWTYKAYLLPSLLALMLLTSMGTFGYLSKAHSDQSLVSGDVTSKIALYDEKIRIAKENIDANRAALKQLDASVDQTLSRSTTEQGAERSVQIRRQQGPERTRLLRDIETEQKKIAQLNEERAPIAAEVRKVEAEVGPIKYIAALIYGDNPENNLLESAVRWVIILIVIVFDPLAIVLILAGSRHLEWERTSKRTLEVADTTTTTTTTQAPITTVSHIPDDLPAYLKKPWIDKVPGIRFPHQVYRPDSHINYVDTSLQPNVVNVISEVKDLIPEYKYVPNYSIVDDEHIIVEGMTYTKKALKELGYESVLNDIELRKNQPSKLLTEYEVGFGKDMPKKPFKGQMHVNISTIPSKLFKFNGASWIEVDKSISDNYTHNEAYIMYLIKVLNNGELDPDDLSQNEQDMVFEYLKNVKPNNNTSG